MNDDDDIVTRLREETDDFRIFNLVLEAADEIELLRAENKRLSDCLSEVYSAASFAVHGE